MEGSIIVGKTASEKNPNKEEVLNLDVVQCNTKKDRNIGKNSLSVDRVKKLKIRENDKPPKIEEVKSNKIAKKDKDWTRVEVVATKNGKKAKPICSVKSTYYKKALDHKLDVLRRKADKIRGGQDHA